MFLGRKLSFMKMFVKISETMFRALSYGYTHFSKYQMKNAKPIQMPKFCDVSIKKLKIF